MNTIKVKSLFRGWVEISQNDALIWAKSKAKNMGMSKHNKQLIDIINDRLHGVVFTLDQLL